jgi:outer membrane beta-barrel protein
MSARFKSVWPASLFLKFGLTIIVLGSLTQNSQGQPKQNVNPDAILLNPQELQTRQDAREVRVMQNRFFTKAMRPELSLSAGTILNQSYTDTNAVGLRGSLFVNEWLGLEYRYQFARTTDSQDMEQLQRHRYYAVGSDGEAVTDHYVYPTPKQTIISGIQDLQLVAAPLYGKVNVFDLAIAYVDGYIGLGASQLTAEKDSFSSLTASTGVRLFLEKSYSLRVELTSRSTPVLFDGSESYPNLLSLDVGAGVFLW